MIFELYSPMGWCYTHQYYCYGTVYQEGNARRTQDGKEPGLLPVEAMGDAGLQGVHA